MVKIHVKQNEKSLFLFNTVTSTSVSNILHDIIQLYTSLNRVERLCSEIENLANSGPALPPDNLIIVEKISQLKLEGEIDFDGLESDCKENVGKPCGRDRLGDKKMLLLKSVAEARAKINKELIDKDICLTAECLKDVIDNLNNAVYPKRLPSDDPICDEVKHVSEKQEDKIEYQLWWASKVLEPDRELSDYIGKNEKTKIVVKLQKIGQGPPPKETGISEEERKQLMLHYYRKAEELKELTEDEDWTDNQQIKCSFLGLKDIRWKLN